MAVDNCVSNSLFEQKMNLSVQLEPVSFSSQTNLTFAPIWQLSFPSKGATAVPGTDIVYNYIPKCFP